MSQIEEPDPRWRAIIGEWCESVVDWLGPGGYALLSVASLLAAVWTYSTGELGPLLGPVTTVGGQLFLLGFASGGCLVIAMHEHGQEADGT